MQSKNTFPQRVGENSPGLPAGEATAWSGRSTCLDLRVDFITAFSIIPAFIMVSKVTRIIGLLSLSAISNKKLLSTSSLWFYKTWQQIISHECSVSMQCFSLYSASFSPHSEGRWLEGGSQPPRRQLTVAGGLGRKKKQTKDSSQRKYSGWKLVGFQNTLCIINTKIKAPWVSNTNCNFTKLPKKNIWFKMYFLIHWGNWRKSGVKVARIK